MKIAIILNGISRRKKFFHNEILPSISNDLQVQVFETKYSGHAIELASEAVIQKFDYILAAGGDGTLSQVVNGVLKNQDQSFNPVVGIIPLGTGNDFARMFNIKADGKQINSLLKENNPKPTDVGLITSHDERGNSQTRYFINVCSLGMGPEVVKRLLTSNRSLGPLLTYLKAIAHTFFTHKPQPISVKTTEWIWQGKIRVFAVVNGQSFGNKMFIAPDATADDGIFSTFSVGDLPLIRFLLRLQQIKSKRILTEELIKYNTCSFIEFNSTEPMAMEADGELAGRLPIRVEMLQKKIKFLR